MVMAGTATMVFSANPFFAPGVIVGGVVVVAGLALILAAASAVVIWIRFGPAILEILGYGVEQKNAEAFEDKVEYWERINPIFEIDDYLRKSSTFKKCKWTCKSVSAGVGANAYYGENLKDNKKKVNDAIDIVFLKESPEMTEDEAIMWFAREISNTVHYSLSEVSKSVFKSSKGENHGQYYIVIYKVECLGDFEHDLYTIGALGKYISAKDDGYGGVFYDSKEYSITDCVGDCDGENIYIDSEYDVSIGTRQFSTHALEGLFASELTLSDIEDIIENPYNKEPGKSNTTIFWRSDNAGVIVSNHSDGSINLDGRIVTVLWNSK